MLGILTISKYCKTKCQIAFNCDMTLCLNIMFPYINVILNLETHQLS